MKTSSQNPIRVIQSLSALVLAAGAAGPQSYAQTPVGLTIQTYAGLTITGAVGTVYTVQYTTDLAESNDWRAAGIMQLPGSPYLWVDTAAPAAGRRFYRAVEGPTNLEWIAPGTFTMGSPTNEMQRCNPSGTNDGEGPTTMVTLTRGFFMGKHELTQGEYLAVIGSNPSYFRNGADGTNAGGTGNTITDELRHPVERVSWHDATNYCGRLTQREQAAGRLPTGWRYRLPTEAEWEYACRAGTTSALYYGPALRSGMANFSGLEEYDSSLGTVNNPGGIRLGRTTLVGGYAANGWGLYDMHGNVWEWCSDLWGVSLPGGRVIDPQGPVTGSGRVMRGGSWGSAGWSCRSASRCFSIGPERRGGNTGFRVVLAPGQ